MVATVGLAPVLDGEFSVVEVVGFVPGDFPFGDTADLVLVEDVVFVP